MHPFDQAIALKTTAEGFQAHTSPDYANMVGPYGGVTCAILLNAALQHPDRLGVPIALTVNFAAPIADGPYSITARAARTNRSTQHWLIEATQDGGVVALATAVFALRRSTWSADEAQPPQDMPAPETLPRMATDRRPTWVKHYDMRWPQGDVFQQFDGQEYPDSATRAWLRDDPPRALDFASLAAISDHFLPRIFMRRRMLTPVGSVSITTYFHADEVALALQGDRFVMGTARALKFHNGFFDQSGEIWSADGQLLASTHQTVYFKA